MIKTAFNRFGILLAAFTLVALNGCGYADEKAGFPERVGGDRRTVRDNGATAKGSDSIFGAGGINFGGQKPKAPSEGDGGGIGVNSYLWRASLDTVGFMPLASADPFGGVIITDWYSPPGAQAERFKITVYILDRRLRADGVKVAVFKQGRPGSDTDWSDEPVTPQTVIDMENSILIRARQLRIEAGAH